MRKEDTLLYFTCFADEKISQLLKKYDGNKRKEFYEGELICHF